MIRNESIVWLLAGLLLVVGLVSVFSVPVWKQNRYAQILREKQKLTLDFREKELRLMELLLIKNHLSSKKIIGAFAEDVLNMKVTTVPKIAEVQP